MVVTRMRQSRVYFPLFFLAFGLCVETFYVGKLILSCGWLRSIILDDRLAHASVKLLLWGRVSLLLLLCGCGVGGVGGGGGVVVVVWWLWCGGVVVVVYVCACVCV